MKNNIYLYSLIVAITSLFIMYYCVFITKTQFILNFDLYLNNEMNNLHYSNTINKLFIFITHLFDAKIFLLWFLFFIGILLFKKKKYEIIFLLCGIIISQIIKLIIKWFTDRPRPENPFNLHVHASSFPSGHTTTAIIFALMIIHLFINKQNISKYIKIIININLITLALLVSFSRIFTQVHYFSDVITGIILAIASFNLTVLILNYYNKLKKI